MAEYEYHPRQIYFNDDDKHFFTPEFVSGKLTGIQSGKSAC